VLATTDIEEHFQLILIKSHESHGHRKGGGPQGPGPPWFLAIAGQSRPGLQQELLLQ